MDTGMTRNALQAGVLAAMDRAEAAPMQWGQDDCALWCVDIVRDVVGYDPAAQWRGRYKTRIGSLRVLGSMGLYGAFKRKARLHGWKRIDPRQAQVGDLGMAWTNVDDQPVLATVICRARGWFVGRNERGWTAVRAQHVAVAWSVLDDALDTDGPVHLPRISIRPSMVPTSAVAHEPISTFIGLTALISGLGASAAVAGAIGGFIVSAAISVSISLVSSLIQSQTGSGGNNTDYSIGSTANQIAGTQITERQPIPIKRVIVGSAYVGGALFFEAVKPPYLTVGVLVNHEQITSIEKVFIGTNELAFAAIVPNTILAPLAADDQPDYPNRFRACFRYGSASQAVDPLILNRYPNVGAEFRQRGVATAVYEYHFGGTDQSAATQAAFTALWGQTARPNAYLIVKGVQCFDPRDPLQNIDDPSTWKWTNNATLVQAYYLTRPWGGRIPSGKMRWDKIAASADYDDSLIGCADGTTIKRHTIDGVITLSQRPFDVMQDLLTANRGMVLESGGRVWIETSKPKTPIVTIHDRILASGIKYQAARQKSDLTNKLQVRFVSPDQEYQLVDGPILSRTDLQVADGEVLPGTVTLKYTQDHRRAQRLQKAFLDSSRLGRTITLSVDLALMATAAEELVGNVVKFDSVLFGKANGTYLVTAVGFSDDCTTLSLALSEYDASIETDWHFETDEQPFVLTDVNVT